MAINERAPAVVLGANERDAQYWVRQLRASNPEDGPFVVRQTARAACGGRVRRIYITPAAKTGRGYHQTLAELRICMARTRGGDTHGPVFLREDA